MKNCLILFLVFGCLQVNAQQGIKPVFCGNEIFSNIVQKKYPSLQDAFNKTFEQIRTAPRTILTEPLDVNVVIHVIWNADEENLADSIVNNQLLILNNDYNRLNADSANLRTLFRPEAGNANIHFHLASIVRVHTNQIFNVDLLGTNLLVEAKHTADGGSDAWNPDEYLNIWVCKIQPITFLGLTIGQILGFAFPPNNLQNWPADSGAPTPGEDGVVIDYRVFGSNNPNIINNPDGSGNIIVAGRTPVHEVGHYLGLRHIWGDGGFLGPNACDQSDGVDDTPYANVQSAFDCDTTKNTCTQIESHYNRDVPDMIENYMDYASESCMNMFTHGQVELMRNTLQGPRSGLLMPFSSLVQFNEAPAFTCSPNPAGRELTITIDLKEATPILIRLLNLNGQAMTQNHPQRYDAGINHILFPLEDVSKGMYLVEMRTQRGIRTEKIVVSER